MEHHLLLLIVLVAAAGIGAQWLAWRLHLPGVVVLLAAGFLLGPVGGVLRPEEEFGALLRPAIAVAVGIVVMEGGLTLNFAELRAAGRGIWRMVGIGIPLVWALGACAAHYIAGIGWPVAILIGALLVITGPTVIQPLVREAKLNRRTAAFLKWEGVLNDALGAVLTVLTLEFLLEMAAQEEVGDAVFVTVGGLGMGLAAGCALGVGAAFLTRFLFTREYAPEYLKSPLVLAAAVLIYGMADWVQAESGLIAVAVFGIGLANMGLPEIEDLKRFKEGISVFLVSGLFIVITAELDPEVFLALSWREFAFVAAIIFLVRPVAMLLATWGGGMSWGERLFVGFVAPRGIVAAALAGLTSTYLAPNGYADAVLIMPLVFAVIILTVVAHSFIIGPLGRLLGLASEQRPGLIVVGANPWTAALARTVEDAGTSVLLSDSSREALADAEALGLTTHAGHILAPTDDDPEELKDFEFLLAATRNDAYNALVCLRFAPELGQQHVYQTAFAPDQRLFVDLHREWRGKILIAENLPVALLERKLAEGWEFRVEPVARGGEPQAALSTVTSDRIPVVLIEPGGALLLASPETALPRTASGRVVAFVAPNYAPQ